MKYPNILNKVKKIIDESDNKNWVIIGDNSIGKSDLLRKLVEKNKGRYYIDSVNRGFDIRNIALDGVETLKITTKEIVDKRVDDEFYNLKDSFAEYGNIERLYPIYRDRLKELLRRYLEIDFSIEREGYEEGYGEGQLICKIDNVEVELSSGYQAIVRIFSELIFYTDYIKEKGIIVIDEIDEFLSPKNSAHIFNFLIDEFPGNNFVVSTHSGDLIANSKDINIVTLQKETFGVLDGNDFTTLTEVNTLFNKLFEYNDEEQDNSIDDKLQRLFDMKILGNWKNDEETEFNQIDFNTLTSVQKIIYKQIKGW